MNKETKIRGIAAVIFTAISIVLAIIIFIYSLIDGEPFFSSLAASAILGFVIGGMVIGFSHITAVHRKISTVLYIPVAGWAIYLMLIIAIPYLGGAVFMLADLVKYLKAKKEMQ